MVAPSSKYKFCFGQQIHHKLFDYYGVIIAVDSYFKGDDQWYEIVARSRPPKEKPWYHVKKTDGMETYVAERNLESNPATNNWLNELIYFTPQKSQNNKLQERSKNHPINYALSFGYA